MNSRDWIVFIEDESLRREIFRYYLQSADKISVLESAQTRKYALERTYNDLTRQIQASDLNMTLDVASERATRTMATENQEYKGIIAEMPNHVQRLVALKATAQLLINRLPTMR